MDIIIKKLLSIFKIRKKSSIIKTFKNNINTIFIAISNNNNNNNNYF